jgi:uncharacterized protein YndB with AHSA1/START domain
MFEIAAIADACVGACWNASGEEAAAGLKTVVTWTLTPTKSGVLVGMEQSGFRPEEELTTRARATAGSALSRGWKGWPQAWTDTRLGWQNRGPHAAAH